MPAIELVCSPVLASLAEGRPSRAHTGSVSIRARVIISANDARLAIQVVRGRNVEFRACQRVKCWLVAHLNNLAARELRYLCFTCRNTFVGGGSRGGSGSGGLQPTRPDPSNPHHSHQSYPFK